MEKKIVEREALIAERKANLLQNPYSKSIYKRCAIKDILADDQVREQKPTQERTYADIDTQIYPER